MRGPKSRLTLALICRTHLTVGARSWWTSQTQNISCQCSYHLPLNSTDFKYFHSIPNKPREPLRLVLSPSPTPASTLYTRLSTLAEEIPTPSPAPSASSALSFDTSLPPAHTPSAAPQSAAASSFSSSQQQSISPTLARFARLPQGSRMEISPASWEVARGMGRLLAGEKGGAGLVVDYGDAKAFGRSWRVSDCLGSLRSSCVGGRAPADG